MVEVIWFEDIEPLRQPVFDFPLLGRISMKQMGIVGSALLIALASKDILIAMVSLAIALFIAMIRYRAVNMDELIYSLILYVIKHKVKPLIAKLMNVRGLVLNNNNNKIMLGTMLDKIISIGRCKSNTSAREGDDGIIILNSNPVRLRLRLLTKDGRVLTNKLARIYLDDTMLASMKSDHNGELDVVLTLSDAMKSSDRSLLSVYVDGYSRPLLEETVRVRSA